MRDAGNNLYIWDANRALHGHIANMHAGKPHDFRSGLDIKGPKWTPEKDVYSVSTYEEMFKDPRTRNYVTWDQDVLDRTKILEIDGKKVGFFD